jgi:hypothetical protein
MKGAILQKKICMLKIEEMVNSLLLFLNKFNFFLFFKIGLSKEGAGRVAIYK